LTRPFAAFAGLSDPSVLQIFKFESWSCDEQFQATSAILQRQDVLVLLATGAGKSLIFGLAAAVLNGVTFVMEPLKEVQVELCRKFNAVGIKSAVYARDKDEVDAKFSRYFEKDTVKGAPRPHPGVPYKLSTLPFYSLRRLRLILE
jgi:superfamily II DNA helicase RecQ